MSCGWCTKEWLERDLGMSGGYWGTWEELILGGAVLRYGTADWNRIASEIITRTPTPPFTFTPVACKERFHDLQKRYSCGSSTAWFDELRKRRVADLKQQLAKSENSIGCLESKIKYLEVQKQHCSESGSRLPALDSEATECMSKETSNDGNSVGSFTKRTSARHGAVEEKEKFAEMGYGGCMIMRKKRSQRKRKECNQLGIKETSLASAENEITKTDSLIHEIFKCIAESEAASVFKHRMDSQKRARYTRVIKQHMDIGTIRSRMRGQSAKEVFRDLLLLANNALVFYSRRTREYKSAVSLRVLVMKEYKKLFVRGYNEATSASFIPCNPPVKPRTARARPRPRPRPCKHNSSLGPPEKQCSSHSNSNSNSIHNNNNKINVSKAGLKRPRKVMKPVDPPPKT